MKPKNRKAGNNGSAISSQRSGGQLIARVHYLADRIFAKKLKAHGIDDLNPAQGRIMFALWQNNGISIQELTRLTSLGKSTLTSMLDRLEAGGHLYRKVDSNDRRSVLLYARDATPEEQARYLTVSQEMIEVFYANLSSSEIEQFEKTLQVILNNLDPKAK